MTTVAEPSKVSAKVFADRIGRIEVSATMAVAAEAAKLRAQGANLVDFGAGEPHFTTPAAHQGRGHRRHRGQFHPLHRRSRHPRRAQGHRGAPRLRLRLRLRHRRGHLHHRRASTRSSMPSRSSSTTATKSSCPSPTGSASKTSFSTPGGKVVYLETSEAENFRITADCHRGRHHPAHQGHHSQLAVEPGGLRRLRRRSGAHRPPRSRARHLPAPRRVLRLPELRRPSPSPPARSPGPRSTWSSLARFPRPTR